MADDYATYHLVVTGIGNYTGQTTQDVNIVANSEWLSNRFHSTWDKNKNEDEKVVNINSEADLAMLAYIFNEKAYSQVAYKGWTFRLTCDLDLTRRTWVPIGSSSAGDNTAFCGRFDGQGRTIRGIHFELGNGQWSTSNFYPQGLFDKLAPNSSVKNLTITDSEIMSKYNYGVGGIVGYAYYNTTIENCHVESSVNVICTGGTDDEYGGKYYGGIAGWSSANITGCTSAARVFKAWGAYGCEYFGGIVGFNDHNVTGQITDCIYYGDHVWANGNMGSIVGKLDNQNVSNCHFTSTTLNGYAGDNQSGMTRVGAYALESIFDVDFGGDMTKEYDYDGIEVYPNAMEYGGVCYTLPEYVRALDGKGTAKAPYLIKTTDELDMLAASVNRGNSFTGKHLLLCNNLTYDGTAGNYTAIGYWDGSNGNYFDGVFDGDHHNISGIHIHKSGNSYSDNYQGVFAWNGENAVVKNLLIRNSTFTAHHSTGTIVGSNAGRIENCHVLDGVSINAVKGNTYYHGGIVGYNSSTGVVTGCSSRVGMEEIDAGASAELGGIAGRNEGVVSNCLALGCNINGTTYVGALVGRNNGGQLSHNYYSACTQNTAQATVVKTSDIGCGGQGSSSADTTTDDGALPALSDDGAGTTAIGLLASREQYLVDHGYTDIATTPVSISRRTLWKDDSWNTLCLPFDVDAFEGTALEGATVMTLDDASFDAGTLTLNFENVSTIKAGVPYIVKWAIDTENITDPVFAGTAFGSYTPDEKAVQTDVIAFKGQYAPLTIGEGGDNTLLYLGAGNSLYYPNGPMTINAFRAYFQLQDGLTGGETPSRERLNNIILNYDGSANRISDLHPSAVTDRANGWYTLDGRRLNGRPQTKGVYVHGDRKLVVE